MTVPPAAPSPKTNQQNPKEKCRICGISETELPPGMMPGFWICSAACMAYSSAHPENDPKVKSIQGTDSYEVTWPGEPVQYQVNFHRDSELYLCMCAQPAHPEFVQPDLPPVAAYQPGIDDIRQACHHIHAVLLLSAANKSYLEQQIEDALDRGAA